MLRLTDVVKQLLIINVLFFIADSLHDQGVFTVLDMDLFALFYPESENFRPYQIVTHFFMHGNVPHLFFNMFALVMFGSALEQLWGPKRFLFFYIVCALGAALIHTLVNYFEIGGIHQAIEVFKAAPSYDSYIAFLENNAIFRNSLNASGQSLLNELGENLQNGVAGAATEASNTLTQISHMLVNNYPPVVGASGAIYGLLLGFGMLFPNVELMLIFLPIPIKAKYFIPILMVVELFLGINQFSWDNIAHFAHLGGALFGFLLVVYWKKTGVGLR